MSVFVRAAVLTNYAEVARSVGLEPRKLLSEVGLPLAVLVDPDRRIPFANALDLLELSATKSGCGTFGLRMAESRHLVHFGAISLLLANQPTLRDALAIGYKYQHLLNVALAVGIEDDGEQAILREEIVATELPWSRQGTELAVGILFRMCAALRGDRWQPFSVHLSHSAPADLSVHRRVFGSCRNEFDSEFNGIVCDAAELDAINPAADPQLERYARQFVDSLSAPVADSTAQEARKAIVHLLPTGQAKIERIAEGLGMSVRSLQLKLAAEEVSFSDMLDDVRKNLVMRYLEAPTQPLTAISALLGYTTPSSFTRWFKAQFGEAPAHWRSRSGRSKNDA